MTLCDANRSTGGRVRRSRHRTGAAGSPGRPKHAASPRAHRHSCVTDDHRANCRPVDLGAPQRLFCTAVGIAVALLATGCDTSDLSLTRTAAGEPQETSTACVADSSGCRLPSAPPSLRAACHEESYRQAIAREIDGARFPFSGVRCDGRHLVLDLDFGSPGCSRPDPASGTGEIAHCGVYLVRAYFTERNGLWNLITYRALDHLPRCAELRRADPTFPREFCAT